MLLLANSVVPFWASTIPAAMLALLPIIVIESAVLQGAAGRSFGKTVGGCALANLLSTFFGALLLIPGILWIGLIPFLRSMLGLMVLMFVLFYVLSVWFEMLMYTSLWRDRDRRRLWRATAGANVISYVMILFLSLSGVGSGFYAGRPRERARRVNCAGNLKQIGLALIIYAGDDAEAGYFPPAFETLHQCGYLTDGKVYSCPSAEEPSPFASTSNYVYLGSGLTDQHPMPAETPLACCTGHHGDYVNVLFVDGHVRGYAGDEWRNLALAHGLDPKTGRPAASRRDRSSAP
jgi:prepilin-type processing-associated H-X9-DG protein